MHEGDLGIMLGETGREELEASKVLDIPSTIAGVWSARVEDDIIANQGNGKIGKSCVIWRGHNGCVIVTYYSFQNQVDLFPVVRLI
jgi:hypothetical protein